MGFWGRRAAEREAARRRRRAGAVQARRCAGRRPSPEIVPTDLRRSSRLRQGRGESPARDVRRGRPGRDAAPPRGRRSQEPGRPELRVVRGRQAGRAEDLRASGPGRDRAGGRRRSPKRLALCLTALFLVLALASAVLYRPVSRYLESRRELSRTEAQLAEERARTRALEERRERALSEEYVEGEARRMGYVKPGEIPLVVLDGEDACPPEEETQTP